MAGGGFQIPLNANVNAELPKSLLTPTQVKPMAVDFVRAAYLWDEAHALLREEFTR